MLRGFANWAASRQCDMFPNRPDKLAGHKNGKSLFPNFKKTDLARKKGPRHLPRPKRKENRPPQRGPARKLLASAALFIFFTASAGARIVTSDFLSLYNCFGFFISFCDFLAFFRSQEPVPLGQGIQIIRVCRQHIKIQLFKVNIQRYL